jgi:hypothetical protein
MVTAVPSFFPAGRALAKMAISEMVSGECEEVVLEAEVSNTGALALYRSLGFIRDKHLHRYGLQQSVCMCHVCVMRHCTACCDTVLRPTLAERAAEGGEHDCSLLRGDSCSPSTAALLALAFSS